MFLQLRYIVFMLLMVREMVKIFCHYLAETLPNVMFSINQQAFDLYFTLLFEQDIVFEELKEKATSSVANVKVGNVLYYKY